MQIVMVSSEVAPWARTGGLGEVLGALPRSLAQLGHHVSVFLPLYRGMRDHFVPVRDLLPLTVRLHDGNEEAQLLRAAAGPPGVDVFAIGADPYFDRPGLYGENGLDYADNARRFAFFCRAVLGGIVRLGIEPDVIHCHDWQSALIPAYLRRGIVGRDVAAQSTERLGRAAIVFTVHNVGYQGLFPASDFAATGLPRELFAVDGLEFHGRVNLMKGGLYFADHVTTVSPRYAREIRTPEHGAGLEGVFEKRAGDLTGILNGLDEEIWNPAKDPHLVAPYDARDLHGKRRCKADLVLETNLEAELDTPVAGVVSRLVTQKGFDILLAALPALLDRGVRVAVLGTGEPRIATALREAAERAPGRLFFRDGFDEALAHKIEAGADFFLMPSRYEPCGLNQMASLRYGTVPIVRATGGLVDTVLDADEAPEQGTGFWIHEHTPESLLEAVDRALAAYASPERWRALVLRGMARDFSWTRAAARYVQLYRRVLDRRSGGAAATPALRLDGSGWQGRLAEEFTLARVRAIAQATAEQALAEDSVVRAQRGFLVAHDTRFLGEDFAAVAAGVLASNDVPVSWCPLPASLPAVATAVARHELAGALVVTAGDAPRQWNGVRSIDASGSPLGVEAAADLESRVAAFAERARPPAGLSPAEGRRFGLWHDVDVAELHREALANLVDVEAIRASGLRVACDLLWGTAHGTLDRLLREWGVAGEVLHDTSDPEFGRVHPEPSPENLGELSRRVAQGHALGLAVDPSGCRFAVVDRDGTVLCPDHVLALVLDHLAETRGASGRGLGRSVATSHLLDAVATARGFGVTETPTGFRELAGLLAHGEVFFAADDGALALAESAPHPDGILAALLVVEMLAYRRRPLRAQLEELFRDAGRRVLQRRRFEIPESSLAELAGRLATPPERIGELAVRSVIELDGMKLLLDGDRWLLARTSTTGPTLHLAAEATTVAEVEALLDGAAALLLPRE